MFLVRAISCITCPVVLFNLIILLDDANCESLEPDGSYITVGLGILIFIHILYINTCFIGWPEHASICKQNTHINL